MKRLLISLAAAVLGIASLLAGLGVDAWLHAEDPTLAEREGIFTLSNPGHALLALGVLLACAGVLSALHAAWGMARPSGWLGRPYARWTFVCASAVASLAAVAFALGVSASGHDHAHAEAAQAHVHAGSPEQADATADEQPLVETAAPAGTSEHAHDAAPGAAPAGHQHVAADATPEQVACGNDLVRRTQQATARFADINVALAEGYRADPSKPDATHYGNAAYRRDGTIMDLEHPESLVYVTNRQTGQKVLLGALFVMPKGQAGPQPCGPVTYWHTHASCRDAASGDVIPVESGAACPAGYRYAESAQMMHVWFVPGRKNGVAPVPQAS